jgi:hypothetical protein
MATKVEVLIQACKDVWDEEWIKGTKNKDNCSGFVKAVARKLGAPLVEGVADDLVADMAEHWTAVDDGEKAADLATEGKLVVGGLKSGDHQPARSQGHVVVVVPGPLYHRKYPMCWCGSTGQAQSQGTKSVGEVWNRTDRDSVAYFVYVPRD